MKAEARAYVMQRLSDCPDLQALKRVWESLGVEYQRDKQVFQLKETLKGQMQCQSTLNAGD